MSALELVRALKHLPGKHPQKSPAGGRGSSNISISYYDPDGMDDVEGDPYEVAQEAGLYISNDKEPTSIALDGNEIVGAVFTSADSDEFSFDIAVKPAYQGKKIGTKLLDAAMSESEEFGDVYPDMSIRVDAVNPVMAAMLKKRGFSEVDKTHSGVEMVL